MAIELRKTGLKVVGDVPWGTHLCCFYETKQDLLDSLVPYFKAGLESNEFCLWVIVDPLTETEARHALSEAVPDLDERFLNENIEIFDGLKWYLTENVFNLERVASAWDKKLGQALARGYDGMRVSGDTLWLREKDRKGFYAYEKQLNDSIIDRPITVLCSYPLVKSGSTEVLDIVQAHQFAIANARRGQWKIYEIPELKQAKTEVARLREELEQRSIERTSELGMAIQELRREITESKQAEEKLKESKIQLAEAQRLAHVGSWDWDLRSNTVTWSDELYRIFGFQPGEIDVANEAMSFIHYEDRDLVQRTVNNSVTNREPYSFYYRVLRLDGDERIVHSRGYVVNDEDGDPIRLFGSTQDVTELKRAEEKLKATSEQLRALSASVQSTSEEAATRIAREIHDELGDALTCLKWDLESIRREEFPATSDAQLSRVREKIKAMMQFIDQTLDTVRRISSELRPSVLDDIGLVAAMRWQARQFEAQSGVVCLCDFRLEEADLDQQQSTAIFRLFQEALTNVHRHSQATMVNITLEKDEEELVLTIQDNGRGITTNEKSDPLSLGLLRMRERVNLIGGTIHFTGVEGRGTEITVRVSTPRES
jgi:PAS domain S-box-containing protein